jgi:hypothetical protein
MKIALLKIQISSDNIGSNALIEIDSTKLKKFENGEIINCNIHEDQLYNKLQSYHASCNLVAQNHRNEGYEFLDTREKVDYYIRVKTGFVDRIEVSKSETIIIPRSISYEKCSEEDFENYFYNMAIPEMEKISGLSMRDILINFQEYNK